MADDEEEASFIGGIKLFQLDQLASTRWLDHHNAIVQLSLRAVLQTAQLKEETVYSKLLASEKFPLLVHDVVLIELWRERVLPRLLETEPSISPLMVYSVLYHEGCIVTLLELSLYHSAACEALGDSVVDLIDYCHRVLLVIAAGDRSKSKTASSPALKHLDIEHLEASIALRCIAILRFLAGHADNLSESVTSRMLTTTDIPLLVVQLMELKPWIRRRENGQLQIYDNGQWRIASSAEACERGQLHPVAAHLWLLLLSLIMSPAAPRKYDLNDHRSQQLLKLRSELNESVFDQIPPLADFERWLVQLSLAGPQQAWNLPNSRQPQKPFILELVASVRQLLIQQLEDNWSAILSSQKQWLGQDTPENLQQLALIYDPEQLEATFEATASSAAATTTTKTAASASKNKTLSCVLCSNVDATHRCSRCRHRHYCSKECQVKDWPQHKTQCKPLLLRDGGRLDLTANNTPASLIVTKPSF